MIIKLQGTAIGDLEIEVSDDKDLEYANKVLKEFATVSHPPRGTVKAANGEPDHRRFIQLVADGVRAGKKKSSKTIIRELGIRSGPQAVGPMTRFALELIASTLKCPADQAKKFLWQDENSEKWDCDVEQLELAGLISQ